jgi:hypothetical protein
LTVGFVVHTYAKKENNRKVMEVMEAQKSKGIASLVGHI